MPWKVTDPMDQRARFVALHAEGLYTMTELCDRFAVSRKTGYKWLARYEQDGLEGLQDRSRAHPRRPARTAPQRSRSLLLDARRAHPTWGPRKLLAVPAGAPPGAGPARRLHRRRPAHPPRADPARAPGAAATSTPAPPP